MTHRKMSHRALFCAWHRSEQFRSEFPPGTVVIFTPSTRLVWVAHILAPICVPVVMLVLKRGVGQVDCSLGTHCDQQSLSLKSQCIRVMFSWSSLRRSLKQKPVCERQWNNQRNFGWPHCRCSKQVGVRTVDLDCRYYQMVERTIWGPN